MRKSKLIKRLRRSAVLNADLVAEMGLADELHAHEVAELTRDLAATAARLRDAERHVQHHHDRGGAFTLVRDVNRQTQEALERAQARVRELECGDAAEPDCDGSATCPKHAPPPGPLTAAEPGCAACGHPRGWHRQNAGHCLECACLAYRADAIVRPEGWVLICQRDGFPVVRAQVKALELTGTAQAPHTCLLEFYPARPAGPTGPGGWHG